jgi:oligogalacturonide lyase
MEPIKVTTSSSNDQLLYFTSSSLLADGSGVITISDRNGHPNLVLTDLHTRVDKGLTFNTEGSLKSYVYFDGNANRGLGKASISLDPDRGILYFIQGNQICSVDMEANLRVIALLPADEVTAFTHISSDGTRLCVPTTDARALDYTELKGFRPNYNIDQRVREEHLSSYLRVYDTATGELLACERVPEGWITHVQFHPYDSTRILYNHEWPSDCGIRRIWLWDGKQHLRLRTEGEGRSRNDWTCHEVWQKDGTAVIYHGKYESGISYIGRINMEDGSIREIALPKEYVRYGHFTTGNLDDTLLVTDGYFETEEDSRILEPRGNGGRWICVLKVDWIEGVILWWKPLCKHGSNWDSQDSHPHPIFDHRDENIYFTTNQDGNRAVYSVECPPYN